jgi:hypothetical protein
MLTRVSSLFAFVCHPRLRSVLPLTRLTGCARPRGRARPKPPSSLTRRTGSPTDGLAFNSARQMTTTGMRTGNFAPAIIKVTKLLRFGWHWNLKTNGSQTIHRGQPIWIFTKLMLCHFLCHFGDLLERRSLKRIKRILVNRYNGSIVIQASGRNEVKWP